MNYTKYLLLIPAVLSFNLFAQATDTSDVEEIVVLGSQIKGAKITGALPVSIITAEDIEGLGVESGEELFANIAENGGNNFNQTDFNGGYNANRGDVGSLDLRNIGTGNTVTLLNGRRIVNSPGYATEWVGGSYVPVTSVNSNVIPVYGAERVEILRDGASAIYGADAVAGVVNTVLKDDFEGLTIRLRTNWYDSFAANDNKASIQWGKNFSNGTNVSVYFDHYDRGRIKATEDPKWANGDLRRFLPSPDEGGLGEFNDTTWRNQSASSPWGQFYEGSNIFSIYRADDSNCLSNSSSNLYNIAGQDHMCLYDSSSIRADNRVNYGETMDKRGKLNRDNLFIFINKELESGVESYTEIGIYMSETNRTLYPGTMLGSGSSTKDGNGTQPMQIPSTNYWLNQLVRPNGDKFVDKEGDTLYARYFRFNTPRGYDSNRKTFRIVKGWRGTTSGDWDWDTGMVWSQASSNMDNYGRVNMNMLDAALALDTPDAYNPFCATVNCNEDAIMTSIFRNNTSSLYMWDLKFSNPNVFSLPAGDVGMLFGTEIRSEKMADQRDPNINGEIPWTTVKGVTFPYVSNIANSSPSPNTSGARLITSLFMEMQIPLMENMDSQFAVRGENFNDIGSTLVGKFAVGYQPIDQVKFRASTSTSFRAPNLITVNEGLIARSNTQEDPLYTYAVGENYNNYSIQRVAQGNDDLESEEATNTSVGMILDPGEQFPVLDGLVILVDKWTIKTENTVGLFGERNHMLLDTLIRAQGGPSECVGNPLVIRGPFQGASDSDGNPLSWNPDLCEAGAVQRVMDTYVNLDDRNLAGTDLSVQYSRDTDVGKFGAKFTKVSYDEFEQVPGAQSAALIEAVKAGGPLEGLIAPSGYGDLIGTYDIRAYPEDKYTGLLSWKNGPWSVYLTGTMIGEFNEIGVTDNAKTSDGNYACSGTTSYEGDGCGDTWLVESMLTMNISINYMFRNGVRVKAQVRNFEDTRAPLADEYTWAAVSDVHSDYGKSYVLELYKKF
jgi:iron complex outermembrane recepter protein